VIGRVSYLPSERNYGADGFWRVLSNFARPSGIARLVVTRQTPPVRARATGPPPLGRRILSSADINVIWLSRARARPGMVLAMPAISVPRSWEANYFVRGRFVLSTYADEFPGKKQTSGDPVVGLRKHNGAWRESGNLTCVYGRACISCPGRVRICIGTNK